MDDAARARILEWRLRQLGVNPECLPYIDPCRCGTNEVVRKSFCVVTEEWTLHCSECARTSISHLQLDRVIWGWNEMNTMREAI